MDGTKHQSKNLVYKAQKDIDDFIDKLRVKEGKRKVKNEHADYVSYWNYKN